MPRSASIEVSAVCATTMGESWNLFFCAICGTNCTLLAVAHRVVLIPGDGTGPELTEATRRVLEATGVEFEWDVQQAGADTMDQHGGNPLPDHVLDSIRRNGTALKGPITTPVGGGLRSVNVGVRKRLHLLWP